MKRLDLVVGPNGAGKSTFVAFTLNPLIPRSVFVNADEIARQQWPSAPEEHSYEAARIAARTRSALIANGTSFIAETVFSHPSKLELITEARTHGFLVALHVLMVPEDLSVARVHYRKQAGGHHVPEGKIRERYRRLWDLVATAIETCDSATVYDTSTSAGPRQVAVFNSGIATQLGQLPAWTPAPIAARVHR